MTKMQQRRCAWCGRRFDAPVGQRGRPRAFCRRGCKQRQYEARRRHRELGLAEGELVVARAELDGLNDKLYVLEAAIEDVRRDLAESADLDDYKTALAWLLDAARPLVGGRVGDSAGGFEVQRGGSDRSGTPVPASDTPGAPATSDT